jgi:Ni,Fe-hydrogenase I cytochrome b subunit
LRWWQFLIVLLFLVGTGYLIALLFELPPMGQLAAAFIVPAVAGFVRGIVWLATGR